MSLYDSIKSIHDITSKHEITDKHIENVYKHYIRIFVDGSRDDQQSCGISLIIPSMNIKIASKVNSLFSATTVEQISIYYAIDFAISRNLGPAVIFSDCLKALTSIETTANWPIKQHNIALCSKIQHLISTHKGKLMLCWLPAHIGDANHELADFCCKNPEFVAADESESHIMDPFMTYLEVDDVLSNVTLNCRRNWKNSWLVNRPSLDYLTHIGFQESAFFINNSSRMEERLANRLRMFCCGLNAYLYKIGLKESNLCDTCGVPDNVPHFLLLCTKHVELQNDLKCMTNALKIQFNVNSCLNNNITLKHIVSYVLQNNLNL